MRKIQLQYPDQTSDTKIVDDLTILSRATGPVHLRASAAFDDAALPGVRAKLVRRIVPVAADVDPDIPANQAVVSNGQAIEITGGSVTFTVAGGVITGGVFTPEG